MVYLILLAPACHAVLNFDRVAGIPVRAGALLLLPLFALLSAFWSREPGESLYFGLQYMITVAAGIFIGLTTERNSALLGLFIAFGGVTFSAFLAGIASGDIPHALATGINYLGFTGSKNAFGDIGALTGLLSLSTMFAATRARSYGLWFAAAASFAVSCLFVLVLSHSTGAIVGFGTGSSIILLLSVIAALPEKGRLGMGIAGFAAILIVALSSRYWMDILMADLLQASGKDATLTGRTYIWERADVEIARNPVFGVGYSAFWKIGNLDAEAIWRTMLIKNRTGFNFHSTLYEIRVHLGLAGLVLYGAVAAAYAVILFVRNYVRPSDTGNFFCAIVVYEAARLSYETIAVNSFHYSTLIVFAALAWGVRRAEPGPPRPGAAPALTGKQPAGEIMRPRRAVNP